MTKHKSTTRQVIGAYGKPRSERVPYDVDGKPLRVGDTVQNIEYGPGAIHRLVKAIGAGENLEGYVMVSSSIAWKHGRQFRKVHCK